MTDLALSGVPYAAAADRGPTSGTSGLGTRPGDLALWYPRSASTWLEALPIGNGRLGAMVFGNVDTRTAAAQRGHRLGRRPVRLQQPARRRRLWRRSGGWSSPNQWSQAQTLIDQTMLGTPGGPAGLPARRQPAAGVPGRQRRREYNRDAGPDHRHHHGRLRAERRPVSARGVRQRAGPGHRRAPDRRPAGRRSPSPPRSTARSARPCPARTARRSRSTASRGHGGHRRLGAVPRPGPGGRRRAGPSAAPAARSRVTGADSVTLLVSIGSSYVNYRNVNGDYQGIARSPLNAGAGRAYDTLRSRHVADYQALFGRVTLDLGRTVGGRPDHRRADRPARARQRPAVLRAAVPVRPIPADLLLAARHPAGQPAGHLERLADPGLGLEVHASTPTCR